LRNFAYAYKDIDSDKWEEEQALNDNYVKESTRTNIEKNLVFVVAFGLHDEIRDHVKNSIEKLDRAEVMVRVLSGDGLETAI